MSSTAVPIPTPSGNYNFQSTPTDPKPTTTLASPSSNFQASMSALGNKMPSVDTVKEKASQVWTQARPWGEFANSKAMSLPQLGEVRDRMQENYKYYLYNYIVLLLVLSGFTILVNPLSILGIVAIVFIYSYLFVFNPDPLMVNNNLTLDNRGKSVAVGLFALFVLWITGAGRTFTTLVSTVGFVSLVHAAVRKPPTEADFDTAFASSAV